MDTRHVFASIFVVCISLMMLKYTELSWLEDFANYSVEKLNFLAHSERNNKQNIPVLNLDVIDMGKAKEGHDRKKEIKKLIKALSEVGFAYIVNVPQYDPDKLLRFTKRFFDLPLETKMQTAKSYFMPGNINSFRGYFPVIPGGHSFKEAFEVGAFFANKHEVRMAPGTDRPLMRDIVCEPNVWPDLSDQESDREFKSYMTFTYDFYSSLANELTQMVAEGLGLEKNYFGHLFMPDKPLSTLRLLHYPSRINATDLPEGARDGDIRITTGEHFDSSFLTILATFESDGLQVKVHDSPWLAVPARKHGLVVNSGALLSMMTDGKLKASNHRVIDVGTDRFSVPFFLEPTFDGDISKSVSGKSINSAFPKYGPWMTNRTSMFAEYAKTDFGIAD